MKLDKTVNLGANTDFEEGAEVYYAFILTNTGAGTLDINPAAAITEGAFSGTGTRPTPDCTSAAMSLAPGAKTTCTATYILTQDDVNNESLGHELTNTATAHATFTPTGGTTTPVDSDSDMASLTGTSTGGISLTAAGALSTTSVPPATWATGQDATLTFTILNTGQLTLTDPAVTISAIGSGGTIPAVSCEALPVGGWQPNKSITCDATYELTLADVNAGKVEFTATATAETPDSETVTSDVASNSFAGTGIPGLTITKIASGPETFAAGQKITYGFTVENTGAVTVSDLSVVDGGPTGGTGQWDLTACNSVVVPGQTVECPATYTLTQDDVNNGVVTNTAIVSGKTPQDVTVTSSGSTVASGPDANGSTDTHRGKVEIPAFTAGAVPSPAAVGTAVPFTVTVENTGTVTLKDITATIAGITEGTDPGQYQITCPPDDVQPTDTVDCDVIYYLSAANLNAGQVSLTAAATATTMLNIAADTATSTPAVATFDIPGGLSAAGTVALKSGQTYTAGGIVLYTVTVTNTGQTEPQDVHVAPVTGSFTGTGTAPTFTCDPTTIPAGAPRRCVQQSTLSPKQTWITLTPRLLVPLG